MAESPSDKQKLQQTMLQQLSSVFTEVPFNRMLGLRLEEIDEEHVLMSFSMKDDLIGNFMHGILHGGVISSVLDMAGGMAAMVAAIYKNDRSMLEVIETLSNCSTIDLQISYLRPGKGEKFIAKAWVIKSGKKITFSRMELSNQDGILIAAGNATYLLS